jgi:D-sedoheptulose 7-phosphate isomerase
MPPQRIAAADVHHAFGRREVPARGVAEDAERVARLCRDMAIRFHRGGKLLVFGTGGAGTDAAHIAVEFMHPVIVGKRALPALALSNDAATMSGVGARDGFSEIFAHQIRHFGGPADIAVGIAPDGRYAAVRQGLAAAAELGLLTGALLGGEGCGLARKTTLDHAIAVFESDPLVVKEVHVTLYHVLWELVHVFFERPTLLGPEVTA